MTGGYDGISHLSSTEIQLTRSSAWKQAESYPLTVYTLSGATINNVVYMTGQESPNIISKNFYIFVIAGGKDKYRQYHDSIYKYDPEADHWTHVGNMKSERYNHAVSIVKQKQLHELELYCL